MKSVQIQLTTVCNERCVFCRKYEWAKREIDFEVLKEKILKYAGATFQFSGGEPLYYSKLSKLAALLVDNEIKYKVYTNMSKLLNNDQIFFLSHADEISVSLDAVDQNLYDEIRRPVTSNAFYYVIKNIIAFGSKVKITMVMTKLNYKEIPALVGFSKEVKAKFRAYQLHTNLETAMSEDDKNELKVIVSDLENEGSLQHTNLNSTSFFVESKYDFVPCNVRNHHRVIDELGREYTCCYAINDNGDDIDGANELQNPLEELDINEQYDYCSRCSRYRKSNLEWENIKDLEGVYL